MAIICTIRSHQKVIFSSTFSKNILFVEKQNTYCQFHCFFSIVFNNGNRIVVMICWFCLVFLNSCHSKSSVELLSTTWQGLKIHFCTQQTYIDFIKWLGYINIMVTESRGSKLLILKPAIGHNPDPIPFTSGPHKLFLVFQKILEQNYVNKILC